MLDWAFAGIKLSDDVTLRAGKIKYPIGLVNEYVDVAYPWTRAPLAIYGDSAEGPSATEEQSYVTEGIDANLMAIRDITSKTAEGAAQTNASSHELARLAGQVQGLVNRFRV